MDNQSSKQTLDKKVTLSIFKLQEKYLCSLFFIIALVFEGLGNRIFGIELSNNVSAWALYGLLCLIIVFRRLVFPRFLLYLYMFILLQTFLLNYNIIGKAQLVGFAGIMIFSITCFSYVSSLREQLAAAVRIYYGVAIYSSLFALLQITAFVLAKKVLSLQLIFGGVFGYEVWNEMFGLIPRATGFTSEPASLAIFLAPAFYYAILVLQKKTPEFFLKSRFASIVIILGMTSTFSLNAFMVMVVTIMYIYFKALKKRPMRTLITLIILIPILYASALKIPSLNKRIVSLADGLQNSKKVWTTTDLSTFAVLSNAYVTWHSLIESNFLGTGLKTHASNYDKYLYLNFVPSQVIMKLNREDAASLYLRILSEMGLPGFILLWIFLVKYRTSGTDNMHIMNTASMFFILLYCVRSGAYLSVPLWFFIAVYYCSYLYNNKNKYIVSTSFYSSNNE